MGKYYIYCFLDPTKPGKYTYEGLNMSFLYEPFYIGKGSGNRINRHFHKDSLRNETNLYKKRKIEKLIRSNNYPIKIKLIENLEEKECLIFEESFIKLIGRKDLNNGCLCNMSDGGERGEKQNMNKFKKKIYQYSLNGVLIKKYDSISEAAYKLNISKGNISSCCKNKIQSYKGYIWCYENNIFSYKEKSISKKIIQILDNGDQKIFNSIKDFSDLLKIPSSNVIEMLKGRRKNKFNIKYLDEIYDSQYIDCRNSKKIHSGCISILQLSIDGTLIKEWTGSSEVEKELKINASTITQCCRGRRKTAYGYKWVYKKI